MTKSRSFCNAFYFQYLFLEVKIKAPYFLGIIVLIRVLGALTQTNQLVGKLQTLERDPLSSLRQNTIFCEDIFYLHYYFSRKPLVSLARSCLLVG